MVRQFAIIVFCGLLFTGTPVMAYNGDCLTWPREDVGTIKSIVNVHDDIYRVTTTGGTWVIRSGERSYKYSDHAYLRQNPKDNHDFAIEYDNWILFSECSTVDQESGCYIGPTPTPQPTPTIIPTPRPTIQTQGNKLNSIQSNGTVVVSRVFIRDVKWLSIGAAILLFGWGIMVSILPKDHIPTEEELEQQDRELQRRMDALKIN